MNLRNSLFFLAGWLISVSLQAQIVTTDPALSVASQPVTIYYDASQGTGGLKDFTGDVYAHTGVLTTNSTGVTDWKYVKTNWGENTAATKLTRVSANLYSLQITPGIRDYYGVPAFETITHMAFVFRSADSSLEGKDSGGSDIFVEVFEEGLKVSIVNPGRNRILDPGDTLDFLAASSREANLKLFLNNTELKSTGGSEISHSFKLSDPGDYWIKVRADEGGDTASDSVFVHVKDAQVLEPLPSGLHDGINYLDASTVQLVLYAPNKSHVFVIGDFNNWTPRSDSRMAKDGDRFWITLNQLEPGKEYGFQYLVDELLMLADPYTEKTLDPNDRWISESTYPGLLPYPEQGASGIASVLQTMQEPYTWTHASFTPPPGEELVIYELLLRDFIEAHDWRTLIDTLDYFSMLGVNAIELMPVNEFENNESWGYNPSFYFAADKYYGPASHLKAFIDSCHGRGIAVIIDMVLNHSYGQSPLVQLYFENGKVAADNPWYNVDSPNQAYHWGYDFDHESQATRNFVDRVNVHWLETFKVDGFRFDFTKGFTNTPGDGWAYDASRIAILKRMADVIWSINPGTYVILEHLADNSEEKELAESGMLLWGNMNHNYNEATMGYHENNKSDFSGISYLQRQWNDPHLVGYMESHDEERMMFKNLAYGNSGQEYDIRELGTALQRMELAGAFFFPIPGPKMIWQFGELGYDYSIDEDCRVCSKPIRWDYYEHPERKQVYDVWADLIRLKTSEAVFSSEDFTLDLSEEIKRIGIRDADMQVLIVGNFGVSAQAVEANFTSTGTWYDFFSGESFPVEDPANKILLKPGQFYIFTTKPMFAPRVTRERPVFILEGEEFSVFPNPVAELLYWAPWPEESTLTFTGLDGRIHIVNKLEAWVGEMDVSTLPDGLFVVQRKTRDSRPEFVKILKISE
ncbi:MAG: alpha-amylase family glycosyl hydrolase [Bacteroidota bacterium]